MGRWVGQFYREASVGALSICQAPRLINNPSPFSRVDRGEVDWLSCIPRVILHSKMPDYSKFHAVFPLEGQKPYDANGVREIETYRKTFHGVLFIDRVLKALGIGEGSPPLSRLPTRSVAILYLCIPANLPPPPLRQDIPSQGRERLAQPTSADLRVQGVSASQTLRPLLPPPRPRCGPRLEIISGRGTLQRLGPAVQVPDPYEGSVAHGPSAIQRLFLLSSLLSRAPCS